MEGRGGKERGREREERREGNGRGRIWFLSYGIPPFLHH